MNCHYSCLTCSDSIYDDFCQSCPATRTLVDTQCFCQSDLYEFQKGQCYQYGDLTNLDQLLITILDIGYYTAIVFSWVFILLCLNHVHSVKARILVMFGQLLALLQIYRYRFHYLTDRALDVFAVFNYSYFNKIVCTPRSSPSQCQGVQNIAGPLLTLIAFIICVLLSYLITSRCLISVMRDQQQDYNQDQLVVNSRSTNICSCISNQLTFMEYIRCTYKSSLLVYFDLTIVSTTVQLCRLTYSDSIHYLIYAIIIPYTLIVLVYCFYQLQVINSEEQLKIEYRSRNSYSFIYDQFYHLNYLDYLYQEERNQRKRKKYKIKRYFCHSNYIVFEVLAKFLIALTTVLLYDYKPQLFVYPLLLTLIVVFTKLGVFLVYERVSWLVCMTSGFIYMLALSIFYYDLTIIVFMIVLVIAFLSSFGILLGSSLLDWSKEKHGKYMAVAFSQIDENQENSKVGTKNFIPDDEANGEGNSIFSQPSKQNQRAYKATGQQFPKQLTGNSDLEHEEDSQEHIMKITEKNSKISRSSKRQSFFAGTERFSQKRQSKKDNTSPKNSNNNMKELIQKRKRQSFMTKVNQTKFGTKNNDNDIENKTKLSAEKNNNNNNNNKKQNLKLIQEEQNQDYLQAVSINNKLEKRPQQQQSQANIPPPPPSAVKSNKTQLNPNNSSRNLKLDITSTKKVKTNGTQQEV